MTFSIIISTFNSAAFIERAARSALTQTYPAKDVIVTDAESSDNTAAIARSLPGVRLISLPNKGVCFARNAAATEASGDWLLFLEHDDELPPDTLAAYHESIRSAPECPVHYGKILTERMAGGPPRLSGTASSEGPIPTASLTNFFRVQIITPGGMIIKREFFQTLGRFDGRWDFGTSCSEDQDLLIRAGLSGTFKFCDHVVCLKHFHGTNTSTSWPTTLGAYRCSLHHLRTIRATGRFPEFSRFSEAMILDLAIRRAIKYQREDLLRNVLATARTDGVSSFWSNLFRISFRAGMAYRQLRHHLGHYFPALHRRFNYGDLG